MILKHFWAIVLLAEGHFYCRRLGDGKNLGWQITDFPNSF